MELFDVACASINPDGETEVLKGLILGSQCDRSHVTPWEVHPTESRWDEEQQRYLLHHSEDDHAQGVRACFLDIMDAVPCHQCLQVDHTDGALRAYVTKYVPGVFNSILVLGSWG